MERTITFSGCRRKFLLPAALLSFLLLVACQDEGSGVGVLSGETEESEMRTVSYYEGESITVPQNITRIASGWNAQNAIIAMLGYGDKIVATTNIIRSCPIFGKFVPTIKDAEVCFLASGELNKEGLLNVKPELVFMPSGNRVRHDERFERLGIPVATLKCNSMKNIVDRVVITGRILGEDAYRNALEYVDYYNANVKRVGDRVSGIPENERAKVYNCGGNPLMSAGGGKGLNQDWMDLAGVINVARDWTISQNGTRSNNNVTMEQVIAADPDVIVSMGAEGVGSIMSSPAWRPVKAVKTGAVYANPKGMFYWCRETSEEALQFLWLAKTVYPDRFADIDMAEETKYFYKTFYGYDLSDEDVNLFLSPAGINPLQDRD